MVAPISSFATDQRGAPRVVGQFADLGAAEFVRPVITVLGQNPWPVLTNAAYLDTGAEERRPISSE